MNQNFFNALNKLLSLSGTYESPVGRSLAALVTSLLLMLLLGDKFLCYLKSFRNNKQPIRLNGPKSHLLNKQNTPCMGGILIVIIIITVTFIWIGSIGYHFMLLVFTLLSFGFIGMFDDYQKLRSQNPRGMGLKLKLFLQFLMSAVVMLILHFLNTRQDFTVLTVPFVRNTSLDLGLAYIIAGMFVITGTSNAVNITDGLDGLAIGLVTIATLSLATAAYISGHPLHDNSLQSVWEYGGNEVMVFCMATVGAGIGFLRYNSHPAKLFMGDTGSLSLGALVGTISIIIKMELLLLAVGSIFVLETLSVILQVLCFKITSKRIFKMAPFHHHLESLGWSERFIVRSMWTLAVTFAAPAVLVLKI